MIFFFFYFLANQVSIKLHVCLSDTVGSIWVAVGLLPGTRSRLPIAASWLGLRPLADILTDGTEVGQIQCNQCRGRDPRPCFYRARAHWTCAAPFAPAALHTQQLSRGPAEREALARRFVEAPERHCPQSLKLTQSSIWQPRPVANGPGSTQW